MRNLVCYIIILSVSMTVRAGNGVTYHTAEVPNGYDFVLFTPDSIKSPAPLVVTLHSRSASGNNLQNVDYFGTIDAIESGIEINALVLAPQATGDKWEIEQIMNDINYVVNKYNVDPNRIYAIGMSMGGNGVADLVAKHPDKIAAAIILAGGLTTGDISNLSKVPLWIIRGLNDRDEAIYRTDKMVEEINKIDNSRIKYSRIKGLNHRQHERILYMPYLYEWLLSHNILTPNRPINVPIDISTKMLNNAYKGLNIREGSATKRKSQHHGARPPRRW